jgi:DNA topoisomerase-3
MKNEVFGKTLVIAEKPSVAQDIVRALTPTAGKFENTTSTLRATPMSSPAPWAIWWKSRRPEEFDVKRGKWSFANLPVIPPHFDLKPVDKTKTRLNAVVGWPSARTWTRSSTPVTRAARGS